jgi:hypothetical protein
VFEDRVELGRRIRVLTGELRDAGPTHHCVAKLAAAFVQLAKANQRHEIALIRLERRFERRALGMVIAGKTVSLGKIEPQRRSGGVGTRRRVEVALSSGEIVPIERLDAQQIMRVWII